MKRLVAIALVLVAVPVVLVFGTGASGGGAGYEVRAIFDFVRAVPGEDVKVAGAKVGKIKSLDVTPGKNNDLIELLTKQPKLANLAKADFPRTIKALQKGQPVVEYLRPYAPDFTGWLTKFAEGAANYDANGHFARIMPMFNAFSLTDNAAGSFLTAAPTSQRLAGFQTFRQQRCPGGAVQPAPDGSNPYREPQTTCDPTTVPPGP